MLIVFSRWLNRCAFPVARLNTVTGKFSLDCHRELAVTGQHARKSEIIISFAWSAVLLWSCMNCVDSWGKHIRLLCCLVTLFPTPLQFTLVRVKTVFQYKIFLNYANLFLNIIIFSHLCFLYKRK